MLHNYIANPVKYSILKAYIPQTYKSSKEYIVTTNKHLFCTWGTEVEHFAFAQLSGFDVYVSTSHKTWAVYQSDANECSEKAFYLSNESGSHFDPIVNAEL